MKRLIPIAAAVIMSISALQVTLFAQENNASSSTSIVSQNIIHIDMNSISDATLKIVTDGKTLKSIRNGINDLIPVTDYTSDGKSIVVKKSYFKYYFNKFPNNNLYLDLIFNDGDIKTVTFYTGQSPNSEVDKADPLFDPSAPKDIKVKTALNGNFILSVKNNGTSLVPRTDYSYIPATQEMIIFKSYLLAYFSKVNAPVILDVTFTGGGHQTIDITPTTYDSLTQGLIAHYEFEGSAKDSSGNKKDGVEYGGLQYTNGVIGKAASFDGINDYISIANLNLNQKSRTVSFWVKLSKDSAPDIFSKHTGAIDLEMLIRYIRQTNKYDSELSIGGKYYDLGNPVDANKLLHSNGKGVELAVATGKFDLITETFDAGILKLYLNGTLVAQANGQGDIPENDLPLVIGSSAYRPGAEGYIKGLVDDLRIYNRALTDSEILNLYTSADSNR